MKKLSVRDLDHPLVFIVALVLVLVPTMALLAVGFKALGLTGPASLISPK